MADEKISALTDGGVIQSGDAFVVARSGGDNKILGQNLPGYEFDYVERSTRLDISATTAAGANTVIDGNAVTYDGSTRIKAEFFAPLIGASQFVAFDLWDGSTDLGVICQANTTCPGYGVLFLTPSAAAHTFHIKAWRGTGTGSIESGAGGAGTKVAAFLRITKA